MPRFLKRLYPLREEGGSDLPKLLTISTPSQPSARSREESRRGAQCGPGGQHAQATCWHRRPHGWVRSRVSLRGMLASRTASGWGRGWGDKSPGGVRSDVYGPRRRHRQVHNLSHTVSPRTETTNSPGRRHGRGHGQNFPRGSAVVLGSVSTLPLTGLAVAVSTPRSLSKQVFSPVLVQGQGVQARSPLHRACTWLPCSASSAGLGGRGGCWLS